MSIKYRNFSPQPASSAPPAPRPRACRPRPPNATAKAGRPHASVSDAFLPAEHASDAILSLPARNTDSSAAWWRNSSTPCPTGARLIASSRFCLCQIWPRGSASACSWNRRPLRFSVRRCQRTPPILPHHLQARSAWHSCSSPPHPRSSPGGAAHHGQPWGCWWDGYGSVVKRMGTTSSHGCTGGMAAAAW